jgi:hypothetical protein
MTASSTTTIDNTTWEAVVREAEAGIAHWNTRAVQHGKSDVFRMSVQGAGPYTVLSTEHVMDYGTDRKSIAWRADTGELFAARRMEKSKQVFYRMKPAPKSWERAVRQGPAAIVKATHLCEYVLILGAHLTSVVTTSTDGSVVETKVLDD